MRLASLVSRKRIEFFWQLARGYMYREGERERERQWKYLLSKINRSSDLSFVDFSNLIN